MSDIEAILETGGIAAVEVAASALAKSGGPQIKCANCGSPIIGPYCAICGQPHEVHRRSVWTLIHDFVADLASFDSRILRTARALLLQPGELACAFREGRTQRYVPALRLYFFVTLIFFLLLGATGLAIFQLELVATPMKVTYDAKGNAYFTNPAYDPNDPAAQTLPRTIKLDKTRLAATHGQHFAYDTRVHFFAPIGRYQAHLSPAARAQLNHPDFSFDAPAGGKPSAKPAAKKGGDEESGIQNDIFGGFRRLAADPAALNGPMTTWLPRVLFLLLPLYALLLAAFYVRQRKNFYFVDHLIFSLTIHTFTFVVLMIAVGLAQLLPGESVGWIVLLAIGVYIFFSMKRFYDQDWFWTSAKFATVSFIYVCFFLLPALGGVLIVSFLGGLLG
ncbi:MAG TPA: DUF3667 domain-containing protein [Rhizomicrobium sp.]|jgi:hypothetical protein|nr:DUF3667 domain-containing protein [Rhizomicrobium sp.]